jgi:hypothetical protein|tara:strand:- start:9721 stop:11505 length:1785 start_codon:yes stop_codon:yes gene_type:complete
MADAKIINYGQPIGAGTTVVPDNTSAALDIESTDAKDYITIDTTDTSEKLTLKAGSHGIQVLDAGAVMSTKSNSWSLLAEDATATNPILIPYSGDPDTGIGRAAEDALSLISGGVEGIRITKDNSLDVVYVGIGGAADDVDNTLLQLNGDSDEAELAFKLSGGTTTTMGYRGQAIFSIDANGGIQFRNQGGSLRSEVTSAGSFTNYHDAIQTKFVNDTSFLTHEFRKSRAGGAGSHVIVNDNDTLGKIKFTGSDGNSYATGAEIFARVNGTPGDGSMPTELVFSTTGSGTETASERIYIRQNGNVGINDGAPNYQLANVGTKSVPLLLSSNSGTSAIGTTYTNLPDGSAAALFDHRTGDSIYLQNNTAENTADGRETGIGFFGRVDLSSDEYHYQGAIRCKHEGSAADQKGYLQFLTNDGDDNRSIQERMRIASDGKISIGSTSAAAMLEVEVVDGKNTAGILIDQDDTTNNPFGLEIQNAGSGDSIRDDSGAKLTAAGVFTDASDIAIKEDIQPIPYGLETVLQMRPKSYDLKKTGQADVGFIAQEIEQIIPEIVFGENGSKSLSYGHLTAVLCKAIQDLSEKVNALEEAQGN